MQSERKAQMRATAAHRRADWSSQGLCICCGRPRLDGYSNCQKCHDSDVKKRTDRKNVGSCSKCGGKWGPPITGETLCVHCKDRTYLSMAKTRETRIAAKREKRARNKSEGICMRCGWRPVLDGKVCCAQCSLSRYPLTPKEIEDILNITVCPICNEEATDVDHDHSTGAVRGRICSPCNRALGIIKDNPIRARKMAEYLENPPWPSTRN
jgi:hypothetical protein